MHSTSAATSAFFCSIAAATASSWRCIFRRGAGTGDGAGTGASSGAGAGTGSSAGSGTLAPVVVAPPKVVAVAAGASAGADLGGMWAVAIGVGGMLGTMDA
jgi:hypothetical protein